MCGSLLRKYEQTVGWRRNRRGVRSESSWPKVWRSLKIWSRMRGGVLRGWGMGWVWAPRQTTSTLGQADRNSSNGSYTRTILLQDSCFISTITSLPLESWCSEAEKQDEYLLLELQLIIYARQWTLMEEVLETIEQDEIGLSRPSNASSSSLFTSPALPKNKASK